ncbi:MAG TPA: hypothetical protein VNP03_17515 [Pseudonocardia sp.]|nr:hypothetical protein [Pseudonocardia sp.]
MSPIERPRAVPRVERPRAEPLVEPLAALLDAASAQLLRLEENGEFPSELRVSADTYASLAGPRGRELAAGYRLIVLGAAVVPDSALRPDQFTLIP